LAGEFRHRAEGGEVGAFEPRAVDVAEHLDNGPDVVSGAVASARRVELKVVAQVVKGVAASLRDDASTEEHSAEATLADGGCAEASPFREETAVPVVTEVVGDQGVIAGVVSEGFVNLEGRVAVLLEVFLGIAVDGYGVPGDGDIVVQEDAEGLAHGTPAFHELARQLDDVDGVVEAGGLCVDDYPAGLVVHVGGRTRSVVGGEVRFTPAEARDRRVAFLLARGDDALGVEADQGSLACDAGVEVWADAPDTGRVFWVRAGTGYAKDRQDEECE
jgi:hypothetical protein